MLQYNGKQYDLVLFKKKCIKNTFCIDYNDRNSQGCDKCIFFVEIHLFLLTFGYDRFFIFFSYISLNKLSIKYRTHPTYQNLAHSNKCNQYYCALVYILIIYSNILSWNIIEKMRYTLMPQIYPCDLNPN